MARSSDRRRIAGQLHSAAIRVLRHAREADRKSPVGAAQLSALSVLTFGGPCSIGELAAAEQVTPPTMTRIAHALERQKLVRLTPSPDDGRVTIAEATSQRDRAAHQGARRTPEPDRNAAGGERSRRRRAAGQSARPRVSYHFVTLSSARKRACRRVTPRPSARRRTPPLLTSPGCARRRSLRCARPRSPARPRRRRLLRCRSRCRACR